MVKKENPQAAGLSEKKNDQGGSWNEEEDSRVILNGIDS